jgi:hypothetical protein
MLERSHWAIILLLLYHDSFIQSFQQDTDQPRLVPAYKIGTGEWRNEAGHTIAIQLMARSAVLFIKYPTPFGGSTVQPLGAYTRGKKEKSGQNGDM